MFSIGTRVRHATTGKTGVVIMCNKTFFPSVNKTLTSLLVRGTSGREWIVAARNVNIILENHDTAIPIQRRNGRLTLFK